MIEIHDIFIYFVVFLLSIYVIDTRYKLAKQELKKGSDSK